MMTGFEKITRQLNHQPVDQIAAAEEFWEQTLIRWAKEGKMRADENPINHFGLDLETNWGFSYLVHADESDKVLEEDEETKLILNGNHVTLRVSKTHASTPEHIAYEIKERSDWEEKAKPFIKVEPVRIGYEAYRKAKADSAAHNRFFCWSGVPVFECMHPIVGHETLLMAMALDPDWVKDMAETYTNLNIQLMEELFAKEGKPDGIWFYEDMGFKGRPFMSPDMYRELLMPYHKRLIDFSHGLGLKVIMHSCGYVEPLLPGMIEAGIDCLEAMEVKAGMDLLRIYKNFGDKIALMGGLDIRPVGANDREGIRKELESKIPFVKANNGFILHSDHSIPESTEYETYQYFLELGRKLGTY